MQSPWLSTSLPGFWAATARDEAGTVVEFFGEIDIAGAGELERRLASALMRTVSGRLLVDLHAVAFMDSTGLHALLALQRRCLEQGVELHLRRGPRSVQRVFELSGSATMFRFLD